ncbi:hypothetical protein C0J52_24044 [Blattella germanica]|nr:hypothetical protein C0J52_24044 [Blattella germanica]
MDSTSCTSGTHTARSSVSASVNSIPTIVARLFCGLTITFIVIIIDDDDDDDDGDDDDDDDDDGDDDDVDLHLRTK